ncbi:hypothetical protein M427DRAFT_140507 [Gonapodya prolifera JEL478]|uniref:Uncharacterized protein n=1 Tax=Gonapodya prolifera (strain JEL478) TaxID=1344416 RepID=A0A138ZYX1_GONPJ|nr:hypothetical protein M427DRAFT_140507 [Gonapodya prolifera JEL478]|eukprot:KXS09707.1 hypothetical protein M427DRAFT_140507 [Gonapodya prolifera JEL478]
MLAAFNAATPISKVLFDMAAVYIQANTDATAAQVYIRGRRGPTLRLSARNIVAVTIVQFAIAMFLLDSTSKELKSAPTLKQEMAELKKQADEHIITLHNLATKISNEKEADRDLIHSVRESWTMPRRCTKTCTGFTTACGTRV